MRGATLFWREPQVESECASMTIDTATVQLDTKLSTQSPVDKPHIDSQVAIHEQMDLTQTFAQRSATRSACGRR